MKEKILYHGIPIVGRMPLFTADNRQAIRDDRKTQTRRIMVPQPASDIAGFMNCGTNGWNSYRINETGEVEYLNQYQRCRYGKPGDVRCMTEPLMRIDDTACYRDDYKGYFGIPVISLLTSKPLKWRWKRDHLSPIHMPTEAARAVCKIVDIRIERLQEISEEDAFAEGIEPYNTYRDQCDSEGEFMYSEPWQDVVGPFSALWDSINEKRGYGWNVPQLVWVIEFEKLEV